MKWGINEVSNYQKKEKQLNLPKLFLGVVVVGLAFVFRYLSFLIQIRDKASQSIAKMKTSQKKNLLLKSHRMHVNYKNLTGITKYYYGASSFRIKFWTKSISIEI